MEYKKQGQVPAALEHFQKALEVDPGYCYAYYQMGQVHESTGDAAAAADVYRQGITAAKKKGDFHAAEEIAGALEMLDS